jgi:hypothetical protein
MATLEAVDFKGGQLIRAPLAEAAVVVQVELVELLLLLLQHPSPL